MCKTVIISVIFCFILSSCSIITETRTVCFSGSNFLYNEDCNTLSLQHKDN